MQAVQRCGRRVWAGCFLLLLLVLYGLYTAYVSLDTAATSPLHIQGLVSEVVEQRETVDWWEREDCSQPEARPRSILDLVSGTCGRRAWAAGGGQRVVSYSLYGNDSQYWEGLGVILPEVEKLYPGWKVRLYTNPRGREEVLCPLMLRHPLLFVCDVTHLPAPLGNISLVHPMMWRVAPLGDPQVAAMMVRDTDSEVSEREAAAVQEWLASGKEFHVMRDHPQHGVPVLGGMWGARWDQDPERSPQRANELRLLKNKMYSLANNKHNKGVDQDILKRVLWPVMAGRVVAQDSYTCTRYPGSSPWPTQRKGEFFVGHPQFQRLYGNASRKAAICPKQCRPPSHPDWIHC